MAQIYHDAFCTIVVANGRDANAGISGLGGKAGQRREEHVLRFPQSTFTLSVVNQVKKLQVSDWAWRAWTYQEYLFSRRILIVNGRHGLVSWKRNSAEWSEELSEPPEMFPSPSPRPVFGGIAYIPTWPDLISYGQSVSSYSMNALSFEDDVLSAFSGVSAVLESSFRCPFIYGLPHAFLDLALLWIPRCGVRRRVSTHGIQFPSWSWMGWVGNIDYHMLEWSAGLWIYNAQHAMVTIPVVKWYLGSASPGLEGTPNDRLHAFEGRVLQSANVLDSLSLIQNAPTAPPGSIWTQRSDPRYPTNHYFSDPLAQSAKFRYPVPSLFGCDLRREGPPPGMHLFSKVQKAELVITNVRPHQHYMYLPGQSRTSHMSYADILSENGEFVGTISVDTAELRQPEERRICCTLIAISHSFISLEGIELGFPELRDSRRSSPEGFYHFYNVLWIEWERGIAYRKALGRVFREFWGKHPKQEICIALG